MSPKILVPLAHGFEEIEAVTVIDVLRRADLDVTVAGLSAGPQRGARGIVVQPDAELGELDLGAFDVVVLPGGLAGTESLMKDERVLGLVRRLEGEGRLTAAICAAPMVLAAAGIERGLELTSHPSVRRRLGRAVVRDEPRVLRSGSVLTSQGPGTAMEFALALVSELVGPERAQELASAMVVAPAAGAPAR